MIDTISIYLNQGFVSRALIVGIMISICSSLVGVTLVMKRLSFIGDGLSHVAFGAMAVAAAMSMANNLFFTLPVTVTSAIILLRIGQSKKIKADAALAVLSVASLAIGYLIMNVFSVSSNVSGDVCTTLFGSTSILTLTEGDVLFSSVMSAVIVITFVFLYNRIFDITFDEDFSKAVGTNTNLYSLIVATMIAVIIVVGMKLVGALLISALVIFPALSAMRIFKTFFSVTICSVAVSVLCAFSGMIFSILAETPVGATIVAANVVAFAVCSLIGRLK